MTSLDADAVRAFTSDSTRDKLAQLEVFAEIESTNSYLMLQSGPAAGKLRIAATNNQTAGRGRHGKTWESPPDSGLCLSAAYTFATQPENFSALTLAIGLAAIAALEELGVGNVQLKWPNDLVANDGKLAGILTEVHQSSSAAMTVVTGIGINVVLAESVRLATENGWAQRVMDLKSLCIVLPQREQIAGVLMTHLCDAFVEFGEKGFSPFAERWAGRDWLLGRKFAVEVANRKISGIGAGIAEDGALLLDTPVAGIQRITAGSIVLASSGREATR